MLPPFHTPLIRLGNLFPHRDVHAKCEFLAPSGCFKIRGAMHLLDHLGRMGRAQQLIVPSLGNTALGAAVAAQALGFRMTGVVPQTIAPAKDEKLRALGVELIKIAGGGSDLLRRARSAMTSLAPTTTGSATAIALIYPELLGKLNGHAVRAPVLNASLTDCVFELERPATADEVNGLFAQAARDGLAGILGFETRPLVSADYCNDTRSAIVDGPSTLVTDGTLLKVYAWYDNEMGYVCRMVDLANLVIEAEA